MQQRTLFAALTILIICTIPMTVSAYQLIGSCATWPSEGDIKVSWQYLSGGETIQKPYGHTGKNLNYTYKIVIKDTGTVILQDTVGSRSTVLGSFMSGGFYAASATTSFEISLDAKEKGYQNIAGTISYQRSGKQQGHDLDCRVKIVED